MWLALADRALAQDEPPAGVAVEMESLTVSRLVIRDEAGDLLGATGDEYRVLLIEQLRDAGFEALGAENVLFDQDQSQDARYLLGGTVTDAHCVTSGGRRCEVAVEWQLFDTARKAVVYVATTRGIGSGADNGAIARQALKAALTSLSGRERFVGALAKDGVARDDGPPSWTGDLAVRRCVAPARTLPKDLEGAFTAVVVVKTARGIGSGVIVSPDGFVFTAAHVVGDADKVDVALKAGMTVPADVVRVDRYQDVAILHLPGSGYACLAPGGAPAIGTELFAVGSPLGEGLEYSVSRGVVSGQRELDGYKFLQTDASINPGYSGGPLLDASGGVVGVTSWKVAAVGFEGLGFGVPIEALVDRLDLVWADASMSDLATARGARGPAGGALAEKFVDATDVATLVDQPSAIKVGVPILSPQEKLARNPAFIGAGALAAAGAAVGVGTWGVRVAGADMGLPAWRVLQVGNAAGWAVAVGGSVACGVIAARTFNASDLTVGVGPAGVLVHGDF